jgi:hypothetical protein
MGSLIYITKFRSLSKKTVVTRECLRKGAKYICLQNLGSKLYLTLIRAAIKKCIEWRIQVQIAFSTEVDLEPSRPE